MNDFRRIAFGYSTTCNLRCAHCVAADGTPSAAKMELSQAKSIIRELAGCGVKGISFTAGEPLLFLDDIIALLQLCKKNEVYTRVVTNAFWAKTPIWANNVVSSLKGAGLSQLRISCSRWHQAQVGRENIVNAASACDRTGMDYFVSFVTDFSEPDDALEAFLRHNGLRFFPEPMIYFGRAEKLQRSGVFTDWAANTCPMNPYLSPELDMVACCDAGDRFTETGFLSLGNLGNHSAEDLFSRYESNKLYHLIKTTGLSNLASFLGFKAREIVTYRKCELCEKLFNSKENLNRLEQAVKSNDGKWYR